jgi:hypothetical protein
MSFLQDAESSLAPSITQESTTTSQADKKGKKSSPVWAHYDNTIGNYSLRIDPCNTD